jgi:predicted deacylase
MRTGKSQSTSRVKADFDLKSLGKTQGYLHVPYSHPRSAYGHIPIPITAISGRVGRTVTLIGGNHGDEYEGPIALLKLMKDIEPEHVHGRILFLPALNWPAFKIGSRVSPIDGGNLNRQFPGDDRGTVTQLIAHYVEHELLPQSDFVIDLHAGGLSLEYLPLLQMPKTTNSEERQRRDLAAAAFGAPISMELDFFNEDRTLQAAALRQGATWFGAELGGGASLSRQGLSIASAGLLRILRHFGVLRDDGPLLPETATRFYQQSGTRDYLFASSTGVFEPSFSLGDHVSAGDLAGYIHDVTSRDCDAVAVHWEFAGEVVCRRTLALVEPGDCLGHLAQRTA